MDILAHGLWGAVSAKASNKVLERKGGKPRLNPWWTGFWGTFPDLLAFTPLALFIAWNVVAGDATLRNFRSVAPDEYLNPIQYALWNLTGVLYPLSHSAVTWAVTFGMAWLVLRRPAWELSGWLLHIVIDIGTHPTEFYPTRFLWPLSNVSVGGVAWATPIFLIVNYTLLATFLFFLREHERPREGFRVMGNVKKTLLGLLALVSVAGAWSTFQHRATRTPTPQGTGAPPILETMTVEAFFGNRNEDPGGMECGRTYPVERTVPRTIAAGRAALEELLKGPTDAEEAAGYFTALNEGISINSLAIQDGVAYVDFSANLDAVGGSCRVAAINSQIVNTLKQFPTVRTVVISVEGRTEDILQP